LALRAILTETNDPKPLQQVWVWARGFGLESSIVYPKVLAIISIYDKSIFIPILFRWQSLVGEDDVERPARFTLLNFHPLSVPFRQTSFKSILIRLFIAYWAPDVPSRVFSGWVTGVALGGPGSHQACPMNITRYMLHIHVSIYSRV
jgi:hypothetical protein